jgi:mono/diheme cytochrome c family protein
MRQLVCALLLLAAPTLAVELTQAAIRGEAVFRSAGGCSCHTDRAKHGATLAGGRAIKVPFGTFYSTNITPDRETGIGAWSERDFVRSMREGVAPDGSHYFPVFPYTSFTKMSDADLGDLWAYLSAQAPVRRANRPHEIRAPYGWRVLLPLWKWIYFRKGPFAPDTARPAEWNRGAYLVNGPGHCSECHTARNRFGAPRDELYLAGARDGPEGEPAPNITPDADTGIGEWRSQDVVWLLQTGSKPDGDSVQGLMAEEIELGSEHLPVADLEAIATYLRGLPAIHNRVDTKKP